MTQPHFSYVGGCLPRKKQYWAPVFSYRKDRSLVGIEPLHLPSGVHWWTMQGLNPYYLLQWLNWSSLQVLIWPVFINCILSKSSAWHLASDLWSVKSVYLMPKYRAINPCDHGLVLLIKISQHILGKCVSLKVRKCDLERSLHMALNLCNCCKFY